MTYIVKQQQIPKFSAKYGLDTQIMVDFYKTFASHINVPKGKWTYIMNLLKTSAWKVILLLMIAINMLKLLKILFLISILISVDYLDLVKRTTSKKIIVSTDVCVGYPKLKVMMMHNSKFFLSMKPMFIKPGGEGSRF